MNRSRLSGAICTFVFLTCSSSSAYSAVINAYFGWNLGLNSSGQEVQLIDITYIGDGGNVFTTAMPAFSSFTCTSKVITGAPCSGMPDDDDLIVSAPTYTAGGDGETTRTIGQTVPINWDTSGAFPTITITDITAITLGATWTGGHNSGGYTVGLIPAGSGSNELVSFLASPQGDIYDSLAGAPGNAVFGTFIATSVDDPAFDPVIGSAFGEMVFAATAVPLPAAVWLFGSGLLGLIGIARRKKAA